MVGSKIVVVILRATGYYYLMSAATAYSVRPFSGPKYHENAERAYSADLIPCAICGKGVKDLAKAAKAVVIDGGASWGNERSVQDAGYMGEWPVGSDCHRKHAARPAEGGAPR